jgi:hypothetical protein
MSAKTSGSTISTVLVRWNMVVGSPVNLYSLEKGCPGERLKRPISLGGTLPGGWRRTCEKFFAAIPRQCGAKSVLAAPIASCVPPKCSPDGATPATSSYSPQPSICLSWGLPSIYRLELAATCVWSSSDEAAKAAGVC